MAMQGEEEEADADAGRGEEADANAGGGEEEDANDGGGGEEGCGDLVYVGGYSSGDASGDYDPFYRERSFDGTMVSLIL